MDVCRLRSTIRIPEYLKFEAPEGFRDELIFGEIVVSPDAKILHFEIANNIYRMLSSAMGKNYRVAQRINLRFPSVSSMPSPDVFVITREAYNEDRESNRYPEGKHVLIAVEIVSPSNRKKLIDAKVGLYGSFGIEAWVVDPKRREVSIHRKEKTTYTLGQKIGLSLARRQIAVDDIFDLS